MSYYITIDNTLLLLSLWCHISVLHAYVLDFLDEVGNGLLYHVVFLRFSFLDCLHKLVDELLYHVHSCSPVPFSGFSSHIRQWAAVSRCHSSCLISGFSSQTHQWAAISYSCSSCLHCGFSSHIHRWAAVLYHVAVPVVFFLDTPGKFVNKLQYYCVVLAFRVIHTKLSSSGCIVTLPFLTPNGIFFLAFLPLLSLMWTMCCSCTFKLRHFQLITWKLIQMLLWQHDVNFPKLVENKLGKN